MKRDPGLDVLLELNGTKYTGENGYWYKVKTYKVEPTKEISHGTRHNLTLHNRSNHRIMRFDNVHAVKSRKRGKFKGLMSTCTSQRLEQARLMPFPAPNSYSKIFFSEVNRIIEDVLK